MKIDYNKSEFSIDERRYMAKEVSYLRNDNENYIPILVQIDSNVLKLDKQKFLVSNEINMNDFINGTLKKKLMNLHKNDVLVVSIVKNLVLNDVLDLNSYNKSMGDIYDEYKDSDTNFLILRVSRLTTYKWVKSYVNYFWEK